jgi:hypothetical protein
MCGRFTRSSPPQAIAEELGVDVPAELVAAPRFNVCPTEEVLVVARGAEAPALGWMRWGLVPWFARDAKAGPRSINARAETVATNRTFREPFQRRRCLVVADGFYEWRQIGSARQPYFIRLRSRRPFAFAAVWDRWKPPAHPRVGPDGRPDSPHGYKQPRVGPDGRPDSPHGYNFATGIGERPVVEPALPAAAEIGATARTRIAPPQALRATEILAAARADHADDPSGRRVVIQSTVRSMRASRCAGSE